MTEGNAQHELTQTIARSSFIVVFVWLMSTESNISHGWDPLLIGAGFTAGVGLSLVANFSKTGQVLNDRIADSSVFTIFISIVLLLSAILFMIYPIMNYVQGSLAVLLGFAFSSAFDVLLWLRRHYLPSRSTNVE